MTSGSLSAPALSTATSNTHGAVIDAKPETSTTALPEKSLPRATERAQPTRPAFWQSMATATGAYGLGHLLKHVPIQKKFPSGLLSPDPVQLAKVGLGIATVNRLNKAIEEKTGVHLPVWATALETVGVIHTLMLGFDPKHRAHLMLMPLLVLPTVELGHLANEKVHQWTDHPDRQLTDRQKAGIELAAKTATVATSVAVGLKAYPTLFFNAARQDWLKPIVGEEAFTHLRDTAYKALTEMKGTREANTLLSASMKEPLPAVFKGVRSIEHNAAHHLKIDRSVRQTWHIADAMLEQKLGTSPEIQEMARSRGFRFDLPELLAYEQRQTLTPEQKQGVRALLDQMKPSVEALSNGTFGEDYPHLQAIKDKVEQDKPLFNSLPGDWKHLLASIYDTADHQLGHQPDQLPLFTLMGSEALGTITCPSGCCAGSVWCWSDVADMVTSMVNTLTGKSKPPSHEDDPSTQGPTKRTQLA